MTKYTTPKISILIPIYNVERYLKECLDSILNQSFHEFEAICINDGSTDGSRDIIQDYLDKDCRFKVIDKENSGYGSSMNRGLNTATGDYIAILESDDFYEPEALQKLYSAAVAANADVAKADFNLYWSEPEKKYERFNWVREGEAGVTTPLNAVQVFYRKPSIWSAIYKKVFLEKNHIAFLETPGASYQDAGFNFKVWASAGTIVLLDDVVLCYRQDNESSSVNSPGKLYCVCDEYQEMVRYLDKKPNKKALIPILVKMRYDSYMWNYDRLTEPLQKEFILRMSEDFKKEDEQGLTDYSLFEPWKKTDRAAIISEPLSFHEKKHSEPVSGGKINTVKRLYKNGGATLVAKTALNKLLNK